MPVIRFNVERPINEFCHLSVLYADRLPSELADGMLGNKNYQQQNAGLRRKNVLERLGKEGSASAGQWYPLARALMRTNNLEGLSPRPRRMMGVGDVFVEVLREGSTGYDAIWESTRGRMEDHMRKFEAAWNPIGDEVMTNMSSLAKREWVQKDIQVHFVDCLWGGFAWTDCIAFADFPDIEVQKKFLAHELSELITPSGIIGHMLIVSGLDREIAHTVVDMIAYFSVKDFIPKPVYPNQEKRGIRPNPNYYPSAEELYPVFDHYAENPEAFQEIEDLVRDIVATLKGRQADEMAQAA